MFLSTLIADPSSMQNCVSYMNLVDPSSPRVSGSSVIRAPNQYLGGHGFDSRLGLIVFLCPMLVKNEHFVFIIYSPSLKFNIFIIYYTYDAFKTADPSSIKEACHIRT